MIISKGNPCIMGAIKMGDEYNFAFSANTARISLILYAFNETEPEHVLELDEKYRIGNVFAVRIQGLDWKHYQYHYEVEGHAVPDPYSKTITNCFAFGKVEKNSLYRSRIELDQFDWEEDERPHIPFCESILYKLHVRGYTMSSSADCNHKGTFAGVLEKAEHYTGLGITTIELMPAYEFEEVFRFSSRQVQNNQLVRKTGLNYWGYTDGLYFAPKASYCRNKQDAVDGSDYTVELKRFIKEMHKQKIEVIMDFYFVHKTPEFILECLKYWVLEYHVDGFHLNCSEDAVKIAFYDEMLSDTKIICDKTDIVEETEQKFLDYTYKSVGIYHYDFQKTVRRYLRGDEDMLGSFTERIKDNPKDYAWINFITEHNGFTLYDLVSYERKHNEENGEGNTDGQDYNYSWNCGAEGNTRKVKIRKTRIRQMKNAWIMLLCSQGVPLIMAGDEFLNSQMGNNNPYCLDNEISWINWNYTEDAEDMTTFLKELIQFRKENRILHTDVPFYLSDYKMLGCPDLSFHSEKAWCTCTENYNRHIGVLWNNAYAKDSRRNLIYIAYNLHWEEHRLALPKVSENWEVVMETDDSSNKELLLEHNRYLRQNPRSVTILRLEESNTYRKGK